MEGARGTGRTPAKRPQRRPRDSRCWEVIADPAVLERRLRAAADATRGITAYRDLYRRFVALAHDDPDCARNLEPGLIDRAYDAETDVRVLCHEALATLNELRDSGELARTLSRAAQQLGDGEDAAAVLEQAREAFAKADRGIDTGFLDEAVALARQVELRAGGDRQGLYALLTDATGNERRFAVSGERRAGARGRVGISDFFQPGSGSVASVHPVFVPDNCHHRLQTAPHDHVEAIDAYTTIVGGLAGIREIAYNHARTMDAVGPPAAEGDDPITIIGGILIIIGAALVIAGATIGIGCATGAWSGDVCNYWFILLAFGAIFIAGGICVAVGACEFVIALFVAIFA